MGNFLKESLNGFSFPTKIARSPLYIRDSAIAMEITTLCAGHHLSVTTAFLLSAVLQLLEQFQSWIAVRWLVSAALIGFDRTAGTAADHPVNRTGLKTFLLKQGLHLLNLTEAERHLLFRSGAQ